MTTRLENTSADEIVRTINAERHKIGATSTGMVLTLIIVTDEENQSDATRAAAHSAAEHPCRIITVIPRPGRGIEPALDANIDVGDTMGPGETVRLRLRGELADHGASVTLPLLLPDTPVVVWWPTVCPDVPAEDPIGRMAQRRVTDAAAHRHPLQALAERKKTYVLGDTDLAWTRTTPWRSMLAAALDLPYAPIERAEVSAQAGNPSAPLLQAWLRNCLDVPVETHRSRGPGITSVVLHTTDGPIELTRPDGRTGRLARPGIATHDVPLARRDVRDLIGEELSRLDPDDTYAAALAAMELPKAPPRRRSSKATEEASA